MSLSFYRCPICGELLNETAAGNVCARNHFFPFVSGTKIPVFSCDRDDSNEYTTQEAGPVHENSLKWLFETFGTTETDLRERLVERLGFCNGKKVLITGVGAGNDLPYLAKKVGHSGFIYAQDFSKQMLLSAFERTKGEYNLEEYQIIFSVSDATNLPFRDAVFDAAFHFGGINLFSDIAKGISEMNRVVKPGGRVVFGDEGLAPWLTNTDYGRMIIKNNHLCSFRLPLDLLPFSARDVKLSWEVGYCFYVIDFTVGDSPLFLNPNVWHKGRRGGTMRTRYYGVLEGVDPNLKELIYSTAQTKGINRVEFLETLLRTGLDKVAVEEKKDKNEFSSEEH